MRRRGNREGSVEWRAKERRWRGVLCLEGRRTYVYAQTRSEVLNQIEKARQRQDMGVPVAGGRELLARFLERWLEDCVRPRNRPRTYALYRQQVQAHIVPALGHISLEKLSPQVVQQKLIADKLRAGLAPRTVLHIRAVLRTAMSQAERWQLVPSNVVRLTEPPRKNRAVIRVLTPDDVAAFVNACGHDRFGALYCVLLALGLRIGEGLGLLWEDVDLDRATVFVRRALQRVPLEDGTSELRLVESKSETSFRIVTVPASVVRILVRHRAAQNRERLVAGSRGFQRPWSLRRRSVRHWTSGTCDTRSTSS